MSHNFTFIVSVINTKVSKMAWLACCWLMAKKCENMVVWFHFFHRIYCSSSMQMIAIDPFLIHWILNFNMCSSGSCACFWLRWNGFEKLFWCWVGCMPHCVHCFWILFHYYWGWLYCLLCEQTCLIDKLAQHFQLIFLSWVWQTHMMCVCILLLKPIGVLRMLLADDLQCL